MRSPVRGHEPPDSLRTDRPVESPGAAPAAPVASPRLANIMIKINAPESKSGHVRYAEVNGRRFRITRDWEARTWYEVDEIIGGTASYVGPARLLCGVRELIERIAL